MVQPLEPGHATECTTVVAMLVESAAVYTTFVLLFFIPFLLQNPISYTFVQVAGKAQLIAPLLIIYREAQGDCDIHIGRFSDNEFASDASYPHAPGVRTTDVSSKPNSSLSFEGRGEEIRRCRREEIELEEL
ncbi:hypothetical protein JVT61DRAFT_14805 [Boletus reticuloceps]|uniref:Uncharacterized protein n=1 Tax=Boletus reticuloceps TaxID=495285 RepID=A0A8I2YWT8_9AGAM|nr:hypothetical protein JVT61DRAFT_14805 [Boletus reticuloceps]